MLYFPSLKERWLTEALEKILTEEFARFKEEMKRQQRPDRNDPSQDGVFWKTVFFRLEGCDPVGNNDPRLDEMYQVAFPLLRKIREGVLNGS